MALLVEPIREIDVCFAIEQIAQIHATPFEVDSIDLKVAPVEGAVGIVMVDLTFSLRVFDALNSQRNAAIRAKFSTRVLLVGRKRALLISLRMNDLFGFCAAAYDDRRLEMKAQRGLDAQGVAMMYEDDAANQHRATQHRETSEWNSEASRGSVSAQFGRSPMKTP